MEKPVRSVSRSVESRWMFLWRLAFSITPPFADGVMQIIEVRDWVLPQVRKNVLLLRGMEQYQYLQKCGILIGRRLSALPRRPAVQLPQPPEFFGFFQPCGRKFPQHSACGEFGMPYPSFPPTKEGAVAGRTAPERISLHPAQVIVRAELLHYLIPGPRQQLVFGAACAWQAAFTQLIGRNIGVDQQVRRRVKFRKCR